MCPIYEYACKQCNEKFAVLRPTSECKKQQSCPRCHLEVDRVPSDFTAVIGTKWNEYLDNMYPPLNPTNADRNIL